MGKKKKIKKKGIFKKFKTLFILKHSQLQKPKMATCTIAINNNLNELQLPKQMGLLWVVSNQINYKPLLSEICLLKNKHLRQKINT